MIGRYKLCSFPPLSPRSAVLERSAISPHHAGSIAFCATCMAAESWLRLALKAFQVGLAALRGELLRHRLFVEV